MTSANFAAAQQRVLERQHLRDAQAREYAEVRQSSLPRSALSRLPHPFCRASDTCGAFWDIVKGREGTNSAFRVGQVDAELLDEELLELLRGQAGEALKYYGVSLQYSLLDQSLTTDHLASFTSGTSIPRRSSLHCVQYFSNSPYGITTLLTVQHCRTCDTQMQDYQALQTHCLPSGRR